MQARRPLDAGSRHADALTSPTLAADTACNVGGIRTVLEVVPTGCHQCSFERCRPLVIGLSKPPYLVGGQAGVAECGLELVARVDGVQELLPQLYGELRLRSASEPCPGGVVLGFPALVAVASFQPAGQSAVCRLWAASSTIGISKLPNSVQLLHCPRRPRYQPEGDPSPNDRRRHIADRSRLANRGDLLLSTHHPNASAGRKG